MSKNEHADDHSIARSVHVLAIVAMATSMACAHGAGTRTASEPPAAAQPEQGYTTSSVGGPVEESEVGGEALPPPSSGDTQAPPFAGAQDESRADAPDESEAALDDDALKQFARAYADAVTIQNDYQAKAAQAESEAEVRQLGAEMNEAIQSSILRNGMTVERFNELASRLDQDVELRDRLQKELETAP